MRSFIWTPERMSEVERLLGEKKTQREIAAAMKITTGAAAGICNRIKYPEKRAIAAAAARKTTPGAPRDPGVLTAQMCPAVTRAMKRDVEKYARSQGQNIAEATRDLLEWGLERAPPRMTDKIPLALEPETVKALEDRATRRRTTVSAVFRETLAAGLRVAAEGEK
jgi:hypothetical protein